MLGSTKFFGDDMVAEAIWCIERTYDYSFIDLDAYLEHSIWSPDGIEMDDFLWATRGLVSPAFMNILYAESVPSEEILEGILDKIAFRPYTGSILMHRRYACAMEGIQTFVHVRTFLFDQLKLFYRQTDDMKETIANCRKIFQKAIGLGLGDILQANQYERMYIQDSLIWRDVSFAWLTLTSKKIYTGLILSLGVWVGINEYGDSECALVDELIQQYAEHYRDFWLPMDGQKFSSAMENIFKSFVCSKPPLERRRYMINAAIPLFSIMDNRLSVPIPRHLRVFMKAAQFLDTLPAAISCPYHIFKHRDFYAADDKDVRKLLCCRCDNTDVFFV